MPNVLARREHNGAAPSTTLSSPIASGSDTTFVIASGTNWPTGSTGVFIVTIDRGQSTEERILCSSRTGTTVTVAASGRGYDGTTAQAHAVTATAEHTTAGVELDELNLHGNSTSAVHGVAGNVVGTSDSQTLSNKTLTSPVISQISNTGTLTLPTTTDTLVGRATTDTLTNKTLNGATLDAASTVGGVSGTTLAADRTSWTSYTPTFGNVTSGTGDFYYKLIGKTLHLRVCFNGGTATATAPITVSLPAALTVAGTSAAWNRQWGLGLTPTLGNVWTAAAGGTSFTSGANATAGAALSSYGFVAVIEVA